MLKIMQRCNGKYCNKKKPEDYVIASGETHTVREFINTAGKSLNMKIYWTGKGLKEIGYIYENGRKRTIIKIDKKYFRPNEVDYLKGSPKKAQKKLNFKPKYSFHSLIKVMIDEDLFLTRKKLGSKEILYLGNLNAKRDWGHAKDYVEMQWKILQQKKIGRAHV